MKIIAMTLILISSIPAFGQGTLTTTQKPKVDRSQNGLYLGVDYMNLTDVHMDFTAKDKYGTYSDNSKGGTHLGMVGLSLGYNRSPVVGFGFRAGARFMEQLSASEGGGDDGTKLKMIIPEGNVVWAPIRALAFYGGLNVAILSGSSDIEKYKTGLGAQAGLTGRFTKNLALNAGYTIIRQTVSDTNEERTIDLEMQVSGFNSSLNYTF